MKIGILTFHKACNCGALIQAWALHRVLVKMGHDVSFPSCIETGLPFFKWSFNRSHRFYIAACCKNFIRDMIYNGYLRWRMAPFKRRYIVEEVCASNELSRKYDLLIVGSDQVWNPKCAHPKNYQLYIGNINNGIIPMVGYSVSCGDYEFNKSTKKELQLAYNRFTAVSFREKATGEELGIKNPIVTLDPSLLLSMDDYDEIEDKKLSVKEDYLFAYSATQDPMVLSKIKELGQSLGVRVVFAQIYSKWFWTSGVPRNDCIGLTPGEMIYHIRHAKYVVSSSFHGTAVSIVNGIRFVHISDQRPPYQGRAYHLLSCLGLEDRMVNAETEIEKIKSVLDSAYEIRLASLRQASLAFLNRAIESSCN